MQEDKIRNNNYRNMQFSQNEILPLDNWHSASNKDEENVKVNMAVCINVIC